MKLDRSRHDSLDLMSRHFSKIKKIKFGFTKCFICIHIPKTRSSTEVQYLWLTLSLLHKYAKTLYLQCPLERCAQSTMAICLLHICSVPMGGSTARIARLGRVKRGSQHQDPGAGTGGEQWAGWSHYQHLHTAPAALRVPIIGPHGHHTAAGHGDNCVSSNGSPSAQVNSEGIETGDKMDTYKRE